MSLELKVTQHITIDDVIAIAEEAAAAILKVYSSHVSRLGGCTGAHCPQPRLADPRAACRRPGL